jgi:hypothetical protein
MTEARTESAGERARRLWNGDATSTARLLLEELIADGEVVDVLLLWVADRVRAAVRGEVRRAEQDAWTAPAGRPDRVARAFRSQTGTLPELDNLELLLSLPVLVPIAGSKTQSVAWRDMTVAHHQARIGMLRRPMQAISDAVDRHEWAITEIEKYGVRCLGDIAVRVLEADMKSKGVSLAPPSAKGRDKAEAAALKFIHP